MLLAGLLVLAAAMLVPAWRDVEQVTYERQRLAAEVDLATRRLDRTQAVREAMQQGDAVIQDRLVAWQLNLLPSGETAIAREMHPGGVLGWIDDGLAPAPVARSPVPPTPLEVLVSGSGRLWVLGVGTLLTFVGVVGVGGQARQGGETSAGRKTAAVR